MNTYRININVTSRKAGNTRKPPQKLSGDAVRDMMKNRPPTTERATPTLYSVFPTDVALIESIASKFAARGARLNNSEIVRAGIVALGVIDEERWLAVITKLPKGKGKKKNELDSQTKPAPANPHREHRKKK